MASWGHDFDLAREAREDRRRDEPDEAELLRHARNTDRYESEREALFGLWTRKN